MTVYVLFSGYNDGYESWEREHNTTVFETQKDADRAREYLLEHGFAQDDDDNYCYVGIRSVVKTFEDWIQTQIIVPVSEQTP